MRERSQHKNFIRFPKFWTLIITLNAFGNPLSDIFGRSKKKKRTVSGEKRTDRNSIYAEFSKINDNRFRLVRFVVKEIIY